jgi:hypothetical protein
MYSERHQCHAYLIQILSISFNSIEADVAHIPFTMLQLRQLIGEFEYASVLSLLAAIKWASLVLLELRVQDSERSRSILPCLVTLTMLQMLIVNFGAATHRRANILSL